MNDGQQSKPTTTTTTRTSAVQTTPTASDVEPSSGYASNKRNDFMNNFYVGGYGGYSWSNVDTGGASGDVNGTDYGIFVGAELEKLLNRDSLWGVTGAIEAFYGWSNADDTVTTAAGAPIGIEKNHEWGIDFRPGLKFLDAYSPFGIKPYGILGYRRAEFSTSTAGNHNFNGFELGAGTELLAYNNWGVRLDYTHVFYNEHSGIDPDENDLRLGVAYHF